ncbi:hypothetical protein K505DRAFT_201958, partial [Melanomma pulvis-pyrius CBS 109.77]
NVWTQMDYVPPRGQCNFKQSIVSTRCPCLRFMLHPLKSASSYECDGCGHHASFHSMENQAEDEIRKRWAQETKAKQDMEEQQSSRPRKRPREIEFNSKSTGFTGLLNGRFTKNGALRPEDLEKQVCDMSEAGSSKAKAKAKAKKGTQPTARGTRSRGKVTEIPDDDHDYIALD